MTPEKRLRSKKSTLASNPSDAIWLFGYGSLMWDPRIAFIDRLVGTLTGFHRDFCVWTQLARGTPELPGIGLGLDVDGHCKGIVFKIDPEKAETQLQLVWEREMATEVYLPLWKEIQTKRGDIHAIVFVTQKDHPQYCGAMALEERAYYIAKAKGENGDCKDYLANTIEHLKHTGNRELYLENLLKLVDQI